MITLSSYKFIMSKSILILFTLLFFFLSCKEETTLIDNTIAPEWAKEAVWYQIFVERFHNGDSTNDPKAEDIAIPAVNFFAPQGWSITPWKHDWYAEEEWMKKLEMPFKDKLQFRRYGGDLQGIIDKLDYLSDLGVNALYLNPINDAPSLHKYDAASYHHVDVNFGPDPEGDKKIIASENPNDPKTWQWTSADMLFLRLIDEVHKRGMKIILDYSWNHTGTNFWAWKDILEKQEKSPYKEWYEIKEFDKQETPENEFEYQGWLNIPTLPEWKKTAITTEKKTGFPYEGDMHPDVKKHIFEVSKRWLAPNGDTSKGIDGYRLDVADHIGLKFWRDYRTFVRNVKKETLLVGEIWWQEWPDKLMNPLPYLKGDVFDAIMFYQVYRPARYFFAENDYGIDANAFKDSLEYHLKRLPEANSYVMMNVNASHDSPRLLSDFYNPLRYKFKADPEENNDYKTEKPDVMAEQRARLYLLHQFTSIGAPHIWNGDEMGMWGADDPFNRKPLMWKEFDFDPESRRYDPVKSQEKDILKFNQSHFEYYKKLIKMRKSNPVLTHGTFKIILAEGQIFGYRRMDEKDEILVYFNVSAKSEFITLADMKSYITLLENYSIDNNQIELKPFSAIVIKKKN